MPAVRLIVIPLIGAEPTDHSLFFAAYNQQQITNLIPSREAFKEFTIRSVPFCVIKGNSVMKVLYIVSPKSGTFGTKQTHKRIFYYFVTSKMNLFIIMDF